MPVLTLICAMTFLEVRSNTSLQAFKCSCEKIETEILFSAAFSNAHAGTAPRTRISQLILFSRKCSPSSIDATPSISTPEASITGAIIAAPCPYASALTTARSFVSGEISPRISPTLCSKFPRLTSTHDSRCVLK